MRKEPFLHPRHKDGGKLQPLRRVKRHERHCPVRLLRLIDIGNQRNLCEEIRKPILPLRCTIIKVLRHTDELTQVFETVTIVFLLLLLKRSGIAGRLDHILDNLMDGTRSELSHKGKDHGSELLQRQLYLGGEFWNHGEQLSIRNHLKERDAVLLRRLHHAGDGRRAKTTARDIDNAQKAQCIARIVDHTKIGNNVFNLTSIIETHRTNHCIRDTRRVKSLLNIA